MHIQNFDELLAVQSVAKEGAVEEKNRFVAEAAIAASKLSWYKNHMALRKSNQRKPALVIFAIDLGYLSKILRLKNIKSEEFCKNRFAMSMIGKYLRGDEKKWLLYDLDYAFEIDDLVKVITNTRHFYKLLEGRVWINSLFVVSNRNLWKERIQMTKAMGIPSYLCQFSAIEPKTELIECADNLVPITEEIIDSSIVPSKTTARNPI